MSYKVFGDIILSEDINDLNVDYQLLEKLIKRTFIKPLYRVSILNPDESVSHIIDSRDILEDGISYNEEYQNGQRRSVTLKLANPHGQYSPSINGIWLDAKFSLDVGLVYGKRIIWFPKGVYVTGDVTSTDNDSEKVVSIQLKDKYAVFESKMGTLHESYEIPVGSDIADAIRGILNFSMGNGYILDYKQPILDPSFLGRKTQSTIRVEEGGNLGQLIDALATQLSAEYYYNNVGNLCFYPVNETIDDSNKPVIWVYDKLKSSMSNLTLNYKNEEVINVIKVVGDNINNGICSAVVENNNAESPICIQRIGRRAAPKYTEPNIWDDKLAQDKANYYLRQHSFVGVDFSVNVGFNPVLAVNNIVEVENKFIGLKREKLLITSISFSSIDGLTTLKLCNVKELPILA